MWHFYDDLWWFIIIIIFIFILSYVSSGERQLGLSQAWEQLSLAIGNEIETIIFPSNGTFRKQYFKHYSTFNLMNFFNHGMVIDSLNINNTKVSISISTSIKNIIMSCQIIFKSHQQQILELLLTRYLSTTQHNENMSNAFKTHV